MLHADSLLAQSVGQQWHEFSQLLGYLNIKQNRQKEIQEKHQRQNQASKLYRLVCDYLYHLKYNQLANGLLLLITNVYEESHHSRVKRTQRWKNLGFSLNFITNYLFYYRGAFTSKFLWTLISCCRQYNKETIKYITSKNKLLVKLYYSKS